MAQAGERFERALRICEKSLPPGHEETGIILGAYGRFLYQVKRNKEAQMAMERSRSILGKSAYSIDVSAWR